MLKIDEINEVTFRPIADKITLTAENATINTKVLEELCYKEMVNHPDHYGGKDNPYEAIKVIEAWDANFNIGTALRYLCRCGKKTIGGTAETMRLEDLKKARWYLDREISNIEKSL